MRSKENNVGGEKQRRKRLLGVKETVWLASCVSPSRCRFCRVSLQPRNTCSSDTVMQTDDHTKAARRLFQLQPEPLSNKEKCSKFAARVPSFNQRCEIVYSDTQSADCFPSLCCSSSLSFDIKKPFLINPV